MRKSSIKVVMGLPILLFVGSAGVAFPESIEPKVQTTLPALSGHFRVGRASFDWVDESRIDPLAPGPRIKRELTVWIWYPASVKKSSTPSEYIPADWRAALAKQQSPAASKLWRDPSLVQCHSFDNADVARDRRAYPVVLMKPGVGALALDYTTLCEDLASHGYIVVASDSPYNTSLVVFHDGRVALKSSAATPGESNSGQMVEIWAADNRFLLDRLTELNKHDATQRFQGRLDLSKVGVFGHSFGGAAAAEFCHEDPRCKAGIDVDGRPFGEVIKTGVNRPFLFLLADHSGALSVEDRQILADVRTIYDRSPTGRIYATLRGTGHFDFSDKCLLLNSPIIRQSDTIGKIDERRGLMAAAACVSTFFDVHLKGASPSRMELLQSQYPELTFGPDGHERGW